MLCGVAVDHPIVDDTYLQNPPPTRSWAA